MCKLTREEHYWWICSSAACMIFFSLGRIEICEVIEDDIIVIKLEDAILCNIIIFKLSVLIYWFNLNIENNNFQLYTLCSSVIWCMKWASVPWADFLDAYSLRELAVLLGVPCSVLRWWQRHRVGGDFRLLMTAGTAVSVFGPTRD